MCQEGVEMINLEALQRLRQDTGTGFERVLALFLKNIPIRLLTLEEAWRNQDRLLLRQTAHKLKGTSATFCAEPFSQLCAQLEKSADAASDPEIASLLEQIQQQGEQVKERLQRLLLQSLTGEQRSLHL
ncbi:MAG: Hpt domain-containing protein [Magnetococcales bacterium]|nr:Hpt domain-containing protein [Magnetococcales bacterium]